MPSASVKPRHWYERLCLVWRNAVLQTFLVLGLGLGSELCSAQALAMQFIVVERCSEGATPSSDPAATLGAGVSERPLECIVIPKEMGEGRVILATGQIEKLSADQFAEFTQTYPAQTVVVLQSLGGDLIGGLRLGQAIRARGFNTYLAARAPQTDAKTLGKCFSACAYAFLGGVERRIEPLAQYGVHQFRGQGKDLDAVQTQKLAAILGRYIDAMGVNRQLLDMAMVTEPGKVQLVPESSRKAWRVENTAMASNTVLAKWRLEAAGGGKRLAFASQRQLKSAATITLAFANLDGQMRALLIVRPDPSLEGSAEWLQFFSERTPIMIEAVQANGESGKRFQLAPVSNWLGAGANNTPGTRQIWLATSGDLMQNLQAGAQFWVRPLWQRRPTGLDERVLFGTSGLRDTLLAL